MWWRWKPDVCSWTSHYCQQPVKPRGRRPWQLAILREKTFHTWVLSFWFIFFFNSNSSEYVFVPPLVTEDHVQKRQTLQEWRGHKKEELELFKECNCVENNCGHLSFWRVTVAIRGVAGSQGRVTLYAYQHQQPMYVDESPICQNF